MKRLCVLACASLISAVGHASISFVNSTASYGFAGITVDEDFESFSPKDTSLASVDTPGILFTPITLNVFVSSPGYTNYGITGATASSILTTSGDEDYKGTLKVTARRLGFDIYTIDDPGSPNSVPGAPPVRVTVTSTTEFATYDIPAPSGNFGFLGIVSDDPIVEFTWYGQSGGVRNTGIDNTRISSVVPEPATMAALAVGVAAMFRRRKR
ncbi:MAG TPA: PEP-CTERM sorting domain-containing protein [Fimbriimonadaceae bacterium]|nr:PEP-CTERM sorting domain-containing protein [Fimbriimonadaceae bacterium]